MPVEKMMEKMLMEKPAQHMWATCQCIMLDTSVVVDKHSSYNLPMPPPPPQCKKRPRPPDVPPPTQQKEAKTQHKDVKACVNVEELEEVEVEEEKKGENEKDKVVEEEMEPGVKKDKEVEKVQQDMQTSPGPCAQDDPKVLEMSLANS